MPIWLYVHRVLTPLAAEVVENISRHYFFSRLPISIEKVTPYCQIVNSPLRTAASQELRRPQLQHHSSRRPRY